MKAFSLFSALAAMMVAMSPALAVAESISASDVANSQCKGSGLGMGYNARASEDSDVSWSLGYDNGVLTMTWYDFVANCCPEGFGSKIEVEDGKIIFDVWEEEGYLACDCMCLFDITATYEGVLPGRYQVYVGGEAVGYADIEAGFRQSYSRHPTLVSEIAGDDSSLTLEEGRVIARSPGKFRVDVFNASGVRISSFEGYDEVEVSTLSGGVSLVRLTAGSGKVCTISVVR